MRLDRIRRSVLKSVSPRRRHNTARLRRRHQVEVLERRRLLATDLATGDIAFIGYNVDGGDDFAIVALTDIVDQQIRFTDTELDGAGGLVDSEGIIEWDSGAGLIAAGTVVVFTDTSTSARTASSGSLSSVSGSMNLAAGGDGLIAYQDTGSSLTFLHALENEVGNLGDLTGSGLVAGSTAITITNGANDDGGQYSGSRGSAAAFADYLAEIATLANWTTEATDGEAVLPFNATAFTAGTPTGPEINITGNSVDILSGDTTPSLADGTNFGTFLAGDANKSFTFEIENNGVNLLNLTGTPIVTISGSSDFSITAQPFGNSISPSTFTTFGVTVDPTTAGLQTATISIANDDANENPYTFDLSAEILASVSTPEKLLLTEIAVTPGDGEFIEIYNPGSSSISLDDYYITDATFASSSTFYQHIVTGSNAGGGLAGDFHARFPIGASIAPGQYQTIALGGSDAFETIYSVSPTYELFDDGINGSESVMREALPGSINNQGGLSNGGEMVALYHWNGIADTVTDVDYALWGDTNEAVDKTGVAIDGPDADSATTAYAADTPIASQEIISAVTHDGGSSYQRIDFTEGAQTTTGGNGVGGSDETSENLSATWNVGGATPGTDFVFSSLVLINEILFDTAGTDTPSEYVELRGDASSVIAPGTYLLNIEGDLSSGFGPGKISNIFDLSGLSFGSNGYLVFAQDGNSYTFDTDANVITSSTGDFGGLPFFTSDVAANQIENATNTFLLVHSDTAPDINDDIDANNDGTADGALATSWTLLDSVAVRDTDGSDLVYSSIVFDYFDSVTPPLGYVARNATSIGMTQGDWVGAEIAGTAPNFSLAVGATTPATKEGQLLNHIGAANPGVLDPGVTITLPTGTLATEEGGATATFQVSLTTEPTSDVTVTLTISDGQTTVDQPTLTFTPSGGATPWNVLQTVTVTAVDDMDSEGPHTGLINFTTSSTDASYNALTVPAATVSIADNDVTAQPLFINEVLFNPPGIDQPNEYIELRGPANAVVAAGTYFVNIEGDSTAPGDVNEFIDLSGMTFGSNGFLVLTNVANTFAIDPAASEVNAGDGDQENTSATFFLVQTGVAPSNDDDIDSDDNGVPDGTVFDGWTILDSVSVLDDDDATEYAYSNIVFAEDTTNQTILSPAGAVIVDTGVNAANWVGRLGNSTGSTAADWGAGGIEGVAPNFSLLLGQTVPQSLGGAALDHIGSENPVAAAAELLVTETGADTRVVEGGAGDTIDVQLIGSPGQDVTVTLTPNNTEIDLGSGAGVAIDLTFTPATANTAQTVTVLANDDAVEDGTLQSLISFTVASTDVNFQGLTAPDVVVFVEDNDGAPATQILFQSFESAPSDTWAFTADPASYEVGGDVWAVKDTLGGTLTLPSEGANFWGMQDLDNPNGGGAFDHTLTFADGDVSAFNDVELKFDYFTDGFDTSDELRYTVLTSSDGVNFSALAGHDNVILNKNTDAWTTVTAAIPDTDIGVRLVLDGIQNGGSDFAGWDNIRLQGQPVVAGPTVESVQINDGSATRSQITSVLVTFSEEVEHAGLANAFTLTNNDTAEVVTSVVVGIPVNADGKTSVELTFSSGTSVVDRPGPGLLANSLADGDYRLDVAAAQVVASSGGATMAADYVFGQTASGQPNNDDFFRLYGDETGDRAVNLFDFAAFRSTFNRSTGNAEFLPALDSDGNGTVNLFDFAAFRSAFGNNLPE